MRIGLVINHNLLIEWQTTAVTDTVPIPLCLTNI
jgi:hypothetical protein